jgi:hypothetical protein
MSSFLFCIYTDDLLVDFSCYGVGCYIGLNFIDALADADAVVLLVPTPSAMCIMLLMCYDFDSSLDVVFNVEKSKFVAVVPNSRRFLC